VELLASATIAVDPLISAVVPLEEGQQWFDRLHGGATDLVKVILVPPNESESG
jgi:L-iditol 2-dehydrogenase